MTTWLNFTCLMPYPCGHLYFDINFGNRLYSNQKRPGSSLLLMLANLRELRVMGCIYFLSNECIITELWLKSTSIGWYITWILAWKFTWLGWGDHQDVWRCSASGAWVLPQSWLKAISLRVLGVWFACVYTTFVWCFTLPRNKPTWSRLAVFLISLQRN